MPVHVTVSNRNIIIEYHFYRYISFMIGLKLDRKDNLFEQQAGPNIPISRDDTSSLFGF